MYSCIIETPCIQLKYRQDTGESSCEFIEKVYPRGFEKLA